MEITKLIDVFGDDIFALALIATKDFDSAKEIFVKTLSDASKQADEGDMFCHAKSAFPLIRDAECNDSATTLTGVELDGKREALLEIVLRKPLIVRSVIHLYYENDLEIPQIAEVTGESEKYIGKVLSELQPELKTSLEKHYKEICTKIHAEDSLKAYVIRSVTEGEKRTFEVKNDAVPRHTWSKKQKIIVVVSAVVIVAMLTIVIPLLQKYFDMEEELRNYSYDEVATDEIFSYTYEVETVQTETSE